MKSIFAIVLSALLLLSSTKAAPQVGPGNLGAHSAFQMFDAAMSDFSSGTSIQSVCNGHLVVSSTATGDYLEYVNVDFGPGAESVLVIFSDGNSFGVTGKIEFRLDYASGPVFGEVTVAQTGDWCNFVVINSILDVPPTNVHNLFITFTSTTGNTVYLEQFVFNATIW